MTRGMLDAILTALCELEASGEPQGYEDPKEKEKILYNAAKAQSWVHEQMKKRKEAYKIRKEKNLQK